MGTFFTIFLVSFIAASAGSNALFWIWNDAHHTIGWLIFTGIFVAVAYFMAEMKTRGVARVWEPRFLKARKVVDSLTRRG